MKGKGQCCSEGMVDAAYICEQLGIPITLIAEKFSQYCRLPGRGLQRVLPCLAPSATKR